MRFWKTNLLCALAGLVLGDHVVSWLAAGSIEPLTPRWLCLVAAGVIVGGLVYINDNKSRAYGGTPRPGLPSLLD
jgi:hypothetical protein